MTSLWMKFNCLKATEPLQGDSLFFTFKSPEIHIPMKDWVMISLFLFDSQKRQEPRNECN